MKTKFLHAADNGVKYGDFFSQIEFKSSNRGRRASGPVVGSSATFRTCGQRKNRIFWRFEDSCIAPYAEKKPIVLKAKIHLYKVWIHRKIRATLILIIKKCLRNNLKEKRPLKQFLVTIFKILRNSKYVYRYKGRNGKNCIHKYESHSHISQHIFKLIWICQQLLPSHPSYAI